MEFGTFIRERRKKKKIPQKDVAAYLGVSAAYLVDVEMNRRLPFRSDSKLEKLTEILKLSEEEKNTMYDLVGRGRASLPPDLTEYIEKRPYIVRAIRTSMLYGLPEEAWDKFASLEAIKEKEMKENVKE